MSKTVAIMQSNYLPWKGYFDLARRVDEFIFYDDRQYTKNDWRNRNRIMTGNGPLWITIPCGTNLNRRICDVELNDHRWQKKHHQSITNAYARAPHMNLIRPFLDELFLQQNWTTLSSLNQNIIRRIASEFLGLDTEFKDVATFDLDPALEQDRNGRLITLLKKCNATTYLCAPAARVYMDVERFNDAGIQVQWMNYDNYPTYEHVHQTFRHDLSIIDVLVHTGDDALHYLIPKSAAEHQ